MMDKVFFAHILFKAILSYLPDNIKSNENVYFSSSFIPLFPQKENTNIQTISKLHRIEMAELNGKILF